MRTHLRSDDTYQQAGRKSRGLSAMAQTMPEAGVTGVHAISWVGEDPVGQPGRSADWRDAPNTQQRLLHEFLGIGRRAGRLQMSRLLAADLASEVAVKIRTRRGQP